jgi:tetratricopeptide (TPR) repeat protein
MFMASSLWVALVLVALVFQSGGAVTFERHPKPVAPASSATLAEQAGKVAGVGDYEGAWRLYQQALLAAPEDVSLWYALGVTLSHLNLRQETEEAFQFVVNQGSPDSQEMKFARQWLVSAGVLALPVTFAPSESEGEATEGTAAVKGKVTWGELDANRSPVNARILLHGLSGAAKDRRFTARATLGQVYRFERVPAGSYRLVGSAEGQRLWDLTLDVEDGKEIALDLARDNSNDPGREIRL